MPRPLQRITSDKYCRRDGGSPTRLDDVAVLAVRYPNDSRWDCEAFFVDPIMNAVREIHSTPAAPHCLVYTHARRSVCWSHLPQPRRRARAFCDTGFHHREDQRQ